MHLLALAALVAKVGLLGLLLARHLRFWRLAVLAKITRSATLSPQTDTFFRTSTQRMGLIPAAVLGLNHFVHRMLFAVRAVAIHLLRDFHRAAERQAL